MVRGGIKAQGHARDDWSAGPQAGPWDQRHGALTPPRSAEGSCATPAMATATASRRLHFQAMPDSLLVLLEEEAFCKGLQRLCGLLAELLIDRQAEQPEPASESAIAASLPY